MVIPAAGESTAINSGTIIVGDGTSIPQNNITSHSAGIFHSNFSVGGRGPTASINTATGIIITGDDSVGHLQPEHRRDVYRDQRGLDHDRQRHRRRDISGFGGEPTTG